MSCTTCPDCHGFGIMATEPDGRLTWCRSCAGWGLEREPEGDDDAEPVELHWPESIRWIAGS